MKNQYTNPGEFHRAKIYNHAKAIQRNAILLACLGAVLSVLTLVSTLRYVSVQQRLESTQNQLRNESAKAAEFEDWYNRTCAGEPQSSTTNGICGK